MDKAETASEKPRTVRLSDTIVWLLLVLCVFLGACAAEDFNGDAVIISRLRKGCQMRMRLSATHAESLATLKYQFWYSGSAYPECSLWLDSIKVKP